MTTNLLQLKPLQNSFYEVIFRRLKRLDVVVLCEGTSEAEVVKRVLSRFRIHGVSVGVTDCEGIENVPRITWAMLTLVRISRRLSAIVVVIDAEALRTDERARSIVKSLTSKQKELGIMIGGFKQHPNCDQVYEIGVKVGGRDLELLIVVNGDFTLPFRKHSLEDHFVKLLQVKGLVKLGDIEKAENAKQVVGDARAHLDIVEKEAMNVLCEAFKHLCCVAQILKKFSTEIQARS